MQTNEKKVWFRAKKYGWGWGMPCSWQGWAVLLSYPILVTVGLVLLPTRQHPALGFAWIFSLSIVVFLICLLKGEKPCWRWGKD